jgi:Asp-tRNA(Asn)/Glu-tRNA(Gln) amidotransferase A subunit family amidase
MSDDLTWTPAWRIRELIGKGEVSPVEVVDHFLGRIEDLDPKLKAFAYLDHAGARDQARIAEAAARHDDDLGPLHGIPTAVKEHIAVAGMPCYALAFAGPPSESAIAPRDDFGVERLRRAGAILVGTNTMMATGGGGGMGDTPGVFQGFNWDKEARNPWDTSKVPGWSSSGGAASAAAGLLPFTIGSDGGGSTRLPAAYSGVVGVHPTGGLFPNVDYAMPRVPMGTTIGPLARSVRDAALVTDVMAGPDGRDPFCIQTDAPGMLDRLEAGVDGMRFAWTDDFGYASVYASEDSPAVIHHVRDAASGFRKLGAMVDPTSEVWEDWTPAQMVTGAAYGPTIPGHPGPSAEDLQQAFAPRPRLGPLPGSLPRARPAAVAHGTTRCSFGRGVGRGVDDRRAHLRGRELRSDVHVAHRDVQLAEVPRGVGAMRLRRRAAGRAADRRMAGNGRSRPARRAGVPGRVPPRRTSTGFVVRYRLEADRSSSCAPRNRRSRPAANVPADPVTVGASDNSAPVV